MISLPMVSSIGEFMSDTKFIKGDKSNNFTVLDNTCLRDVNISWRAKGLHSYLESLPGDWKLLKTDLIKRSTDKRTALNSAIDELVEAGYIRIESRRLPNGRFDSNCYYVFEKPATIDQCRLTATVKPQTDNPNTETKQLLTTDKLNNDIPRTELTNAESENDNGSAFVNIIKGLFGGEYPFDVNFRSSVLKQLVDAGIEESNLEAFLNYVFERTKLGNVRKSFEGLFRNLALAGSIIRDFKNSCFIKKDQKKKTVEPQIKYIDCPICSTRFKEYDFNCPVCGVSLAEIQDETCAGYRAKKHIYEMSDSEKESYESAWHEFSKKIKEQTGRPFLTEDEKIQFWMEKNII